MGCANYTITFNCVEADSLNVVYIVLNAPQYSSPAQVATIKQKWSDGTTTSAYFNRPVTMKANGISQFSSISGLESQGTIPADGSTVTLELVDDNSFEFDTSKHSFKYLVSNTEYTESDINTLIPLLTTTSTIITTPTADGTVYSSTFTYSNPSDDGYLYIVWDLRYSNQITLDYDASLALTACCSGASGTYYVNGTSFSKATMVYTDADLLTEASDGYYANGSYFRELDSALTVPLISQKLCEACTGAGGGYYAYETNNNTFYKASEACSDTDPNTGLGGFKAAGPGTTAELEVGDILYTNEFLTTPITGFNLWKHYLIPGASYTVSAKLDNSGNVLEVVKCFL